MPAAAPAPALHCLIRSLIQADTIIRDLRAAALDGYSLITSARSSGPEAGIGPVGTFLARSGLDEMAALDLPRAGRCVVGGHLLPILFGLANASHHAGIPEALVELGMSAADADHCAAMIAQGWTLIHVPVTTQRALVRCERIFHQSGVASATPAAAAHPLPARAQKLPAHPAAHAAHGAGEAWVSAVHPRRAHPSPSPAGPAILAEAAW